MNRTVGTAALAALLAIPLLLAGCSSSAPGRDGPGSSTWEAPAEARSMQPLRNALPEAIEQVHWANGSVPAQNACNPIGCAQGEATWRRVTDLTPALPTLATVQLEVELLYEPHVLFGQAMQVTLDSPESVRYAHTQTDEPGRSAFVATLLARGQVSAVVSVYQMNGQVPEIPYSLRIRIVASPTLVSPGVPVGLALAGGDTLQVGADGDGRDFILFGPDGARVGAFQGKVTLDAVARSGEYAVLLPPGASSALASDNGDSAMRPLGLRYETSPPATVPQAGAMESSWDVTGLPIGVGLRIFTQEVAATLAPFITTDLSARINGPNGFVVESDMLGGYVTFGELGEELRWTSALGDERVTAGTYTVHAESTATYEAHVEGFAVYIDASA